MKFRCSKTNTFCLAAVHEKVNLLHFLSQWSRKEHVRKNLKKDYKRAAVELWRAKVPLSTVRNQLKVFERTLRRVLASKGPSPSTRSSSGSLCQGTEENRHAHQDSGNHYSRGGNEQIPVLFMASIHISQQKTFLTLFIHVALFIEFVYDRPRLLAGTVPPACV